MMPCQAELVKTVCLINHDASGPTRRAECAEADGHLNLARRIRIPLGWGVTGFNCPPGPVDGLRVGFLSNPIVEAWALCEPRPLTTESGGSTG